MLRRHRICEMCRKPELFQNDEFIFREDFGFVCEGCYEVHQLDFVEDYLYKPEPMFFPFTTNSSQELYVGMELELLVESARLDQFLEEHAPKCYFKVDRSLDFGGVELVTHPMKPSLMRRFISEIREDLLKFEVPSDNYGLHFHINKSFFGGTTNFVVHQLIWNCLLISGRYDHITERPQGSPHCELEVGSGSRNLSLNISNKNTIEFRSFKASTDYKKLLSKLDMAVSFCHFMKKKLKRSK